MLYTWQNKLALQIPSRRLLHWSEDSFHSSLWRCRGQRGSQLPRESHQTLLAPSKGPLQRPCGCRWSPAQCEMFQGGSKPRESVQAMGLCYLQNSAQIISHFPGVPKIQKMEDCKFFIPFWADKSRKQPLAKYLTKSDSRLCVASNRGVCLFDPHDGSCHPDGFQDCSPSYNIFLSLLPLLRLAHPPRPLWNVSHSPRRPLPCRYPLSVPVLLSTQQFRD